MGFDTRRTSIFIKSNLQRKVTGFHCLYIARILGNSRLYIYTLFPSTFPDYEGLK